MKRITPEQVVAAYKKTGMRPTVGHTFIANGPGGRKSVCAIAVLCYPRSVQPLSLGLNYTYAFGFMAGFDGHSPEPRAPKPYFVGFADGVDAHLATIKAGLYSEVES